MGEVKTLYRVYDEINPTGLTLRFQEYTVIGETPKCWYVIRSHLAYMTQVPGCAEEIKRQRKLVLKEQGGRRHCYVDKSTAMRSYLKRKRRQARHAELSLERSIAGVRAAEALLKAEGGICLPHTEPSEYIECLGWEDC